MARGVVAVGGGAVVAGVCDPEDEGLGKSHVQRAEIEGDVGRQTGEALAVLGVEPAACLVADALGVVGGRPVGIANVLVTDAMTVPGRPLPTMSGRVVGLDAGASKMLSVIGSLNVEPGAVTQLLPVPARV
jgi:hypothetical protein